MASCDRIASTFMVTRRLVSGHMRGTGCVCRLVALSAALLVAIPAISDSPKTEPAAGLAIVSISVANLTGDPLIAPAVAESLFCRLMKLSAFAYGEPPSGAGQGIVGGYFELPNPFSLSLGAASGLAGLSVDIELEQSYYGPIVDPKSEVMTFWVFGILGTAFSGHDAVIGIVEWRARIRESDGQQPLTIIGQGACAGRAPVLSRREAILRANKRAMLHLAYEMTRAVNRERSLSLKKKALHDNQSAYLQRADGW